MQNFIIEILLLVFIVMAYFIGYYRGKCVKCEEIIEDVIRKANDPEPNIIKEFKFYGSEGEDYE